MPVVTRNKVTIKIGEKPVNFTTIDLANMSKTDGEKLRDKIKARNHYMNFEIILAPIPSGYHVSAQTKYNDSKDEILGTFLWLMATSI